MSANANGSQQRAYETRSQLERPPICRGPSKAQTVGGSEWTVKCESVTKAALLDDAHPKKPHIQAIQKNRHFGAPA
jgi:hypothetical protein